jgi:hypothetical protein
MLPLLCIKGFLLQPTISGLKRSGKANSGMYTGKVIAAAI